MNGLEINLSSKSQLGLEYNTENLTFQKHEKPSKKECFGGTFWPKFPISPSITSRKAVSIHRLIDESIGTP